MRSHQRGGKDLAWVSAVGGGFDDQGAVTGIADRPDQDERAVRTEVLLMETEHPGRFDTPAEHPMTQTIPVHGEHPIPTQWSRPAGRRPSTAVTGSGPAPADEF